MKERLFNLRGVPDDERDEIAALLEEHGVDFYITPAGNWGISSPAFWLRDGRELEAARALIESYQVERAQRAQADWQQRCSDGSADRLRDRVLRDPLRSLLLLALIALVLYVSISPFLSL